MKSVLAWAEGAGPAEGTVGPAIDPGFLADIFYPLSPFGTIKSDIKYPPLSVERAIHIISTP